LGGGGWSRAKVASFFIPQQPQHAHQRHQRRRLDPPPLPTVDLYDKPLATSRPPDRTCPQSWPTNLSPTPTTTTLRSQAVTHSNTAPHAVTHHHTNTHPSRYSPTMPFYSPAGIQPAAHILCHKALSGTQRRTEARQSTQLVKMREAAYKTVVHRRKDMVDKSLARSGSLSSMGTAGEQGEHKAS